jgi:hypothetical protein
LFGALSFASCDKFFDVNTDPNNPEEVVYEKVLPAGIGSSATVIGGQYAILGSLWSQHFTQSNTANQYKDLDSYEFTNNKFETAWNEMYAGAMSDLTIVINEAAEAEDWATHLMAVVMRSYDFVVMADLYDKVPYTEAFQSTAILGPKYDDGQFIYDSVIKELDEAMAKDFGASTNKNVGSADFIFGGNVDKWIRFANTLKLKMYLRMVNADPAKAQAGVSALWSAGANFLTEAACMDAFANQAGKYNPLYGSDVSSNGLGDLNLRASNTLFNYLTNSADSRLEKIYKPISAGNPMLSHPQGDYNNPESQNRLARGNWVATQPVYFFTEAEIYFLQAEALMRYPSLGDNAGELYENGVKASFALLGAEGADALLAGAYSYTTAEDKLALIITQKWISQAMFNPIESFFDFNRTGFPSVFEISKTSTIGNLFPQRLVAENTNEGRDNPNVPRGISIEMKVWWAK